MTDMCRPYCSMPPLRSAYVMLARRASMDLVDIGDLRRVPTKAMENMRRITITPSRPPPNLRQQRCVVIQPLAAVRADTLRLCGHNAWISWIFRALAVGIEALVRLKLRFASRRGAPRRASLMQRHAPCGRHTGKRLTYRVVADPPRPGAACAPLFPYCAHVFWSHTAHIARHRPHEPHHHAGPYRAPNTQRTNW